jgi:hypothetical protein
MNLLQNPDPQSLEFGRRGNQCAHLTSPFCNPSRNSPSDKAARKRSWPPDSCAPLLHSSIAAPRDCLYLTSDRRLAPLPFPVATEAKDDTGGQCRQRFYPERAVLRATCVTVAVVTIADNPPEREESPLAEEDLGNDSDGLWCSPPKGPQSSLAGDFPSEMAASR